MDNTIMIGVTDLRHDVDNNLPLKDRLKIVMQKALNHWLINDEESQFKIAVGAVMVEATEEERERIKIDLKFLQAISSAISGVPVDFGRLVEELGDDVAKKAVGLQALWQEAKEEAKGVKK